MTERPDITDWDAYYGRIANYTRLTRAITKRKLLALMRQCLDERGRAAICEFGGANSFMAPALLRDARVTNYHAIDNNRVGLELLEGPKQNFPNLTWEQRDLLKADPAQKLGSFDIVLSIGLVEHFCVEDTARLVELHFQTCLPAGFVLITFPTPTWLYSTIRGAAERAGRWNFPDERPLAAREVMDVADRLGRCRHHSINWAIGLTQAVLLYQKT